MPTSTISNTVKDQSGTAVPNIPVIIDLIPGPAFRLTDGSEILPVVELKSDLTGLWTTPLEQNSNIDPSSSYYRVREMLPKVKGGPRTWFFLVPSANSKLHDCLTTPSIASSLIRPTVVTSTTRPSSPYVGQMIFETDTGKVLYYYGTTLGWLPDWGVAWGELAGISFVGTFTTSSTTYVSITNVFVNATPIQGRQYSTLASFWIENATAVASVGVAIADGPGTILDERLITIGATPIQVPLEIWRKEGAISGPLIRKTMIKTSAGTATANNDVSHPGVVSIRDIGPRTPPVIT